jgi:hypothetical protein
MTVEYAATLTASVMLGLVPSIIGQQALRISVIATTCALERVTLDG